MTAGRRPRTAGELRVAQDEALNAHALLVALQTRVGGTFHMPRSQHTGFGDLGGRCKSLDFIPRAKR